MVKLNFGDGSAATTDTAAITPNLTSGVNTPDNPVLSDTTHTSFNNALSYGLPGAVVGAVDTLGQSLHVLKNDSMPNALKQYLGADPNSFGDFYTRNQAALRATGEVATMLLPGLVAMKGLKAVNGLREAGSIGSWAKNSTALDVLLGNSAEMAASQGAITTEAETALYNQGVFAGRTVNTPAMRAAKLDLFGKKAVDAVRTTAAFEIGNYAAFNSSQLFYPADMTVYDQAKWAGAGLGVGVGLELAATRYAARQMIKSVTNRMSSGAAADVFNLSPTQKYIDQVMFRPGERGVGLTAYAGMQSDLTALGKQAENTSTFNTSVYQDQVNIKAVQTKQVGLMAYDPHMFVPRTSLDDGQTNLVLNNLSTNPTILLNATKLGQLPEGGTAEFYANIAKGMDKAKKDMETATILAGLEENPLKKSQILNDAARAFNPVYEAATEVHYVMEPTGGFTLLKNRADNWLDTNSFSAIKSKPYTTKLPDREEPIKNLKLMADADHKIVLHDNFRIETVNNPTPLDHSAMYAMGSNMIQRWKPIEGQQLILTPQMNWRQLEMTSALVKQKPEAMKQVVLGSGLRDIPETNAGGYIFHGSSTELGSNSLIDYYGSNLNYYGSGLYTTDSMKIAAGYSQKGRGTSPTIHSLVEKGKPKLLNMELPLSNPEIKSIVDIRAGGSDIVAQALDEKPKNLRELYDHIRDVGTSEGMTASDIQEEFDGFVELIENKGYAGLQHTGGLRTGNAPHQVKIYFKPSQDLSIGQKQSVVKTDTGLKLGDESGPGFSSLDDVDFHVLNEKFKEYTKLQNNIERPAIAPKGSLLGRIGGPAEKLTPAQITARLNLPVPSGMEINPVMEMFAHARLQGMKDLNEMFPKPNQGRAFEQPYTQLDLVKQHLKETAGVETEVPFQGNLLKQTSDTKPVFVAAKAMPEMSIADANIQARVMVMRDVHLERLASIDASSSPLVAGVINKIFNASNPGGNLGANANTARMVQSLQDGVLSGTGQLTYQDRINSQFPALKALQLLAQDTDHFITQYTEQLAAANLTPKFAGVLHPKNKADLFDFNRIEQAYRHGWEIKAVMPSPDGKGYSFLLDEDSKINKQLHELHFPNTEEVPEFMPDMSVTAKKNGLTPLVVSKNASDLATAISDMSKQSGRENNTLRAALGKNPIKIRDFHLPSPELNKDGTWFVYNSQSNVVATYTGPNIGQNEQRAKEAAKTLGEGHTAVPLETVKFDRQQNDDTFFDLVNYSDQLAKTGAGIRGGLAHTEIDTGDVTLKAMVRSLQEQFLHAGIRARAAVFEPELNYARQAADAATAVTRQNQGGHNIFDRYIATMFSQAPKAVKSGKPGLITSAYRGIEDGLDRSLSYAYAHFAELTANSDAGKAGANILKSLVRSRSSEAEIKQYASTMPEWSPFKDAEEWAESTFRERGKFTARNMAGQLAKLSSTMSLRFLDVGTAINNFAGLATNMHSVTYGLRRLASESREEWLSRTAAYGSEYVDGIMTFDPNKALNVAIKAYWKGELNAPMEAAAKQGYFKPEYAALAKALTSPQTPGQKAIENFAHYANGLADNSEMLSRKMAWGLGYKIGKDLHGFKNENDAYIFANNFVNDMIGNYSPNNKPAMFQGAAGLVLGTFQTYMFNFYRRLYENIETGNKAALMAQYAAQASIFGWRSVPGYQAWNAVFQSNQDGSDDFTGRLRRTMAPGVGDLLLNGSLSNIPKIWGGLQGNGLAFYTRGSVDMTQPFPTLLDISRAPPVQFLTNTWDGVKATVKNLAQGYSMQQQEEILANFSTNRAIKSIMELAADAKTSKSGDVIEASTRDWWHVAAATAGTQTNYARSQQEAYSRNQAVKLAQADLRETLNAHTKAVLRGGDFTTDDLRGIVQQYLNARGNPAYLGQWFRNELMMATEPRTQKQLEGLARSGKLTEFQDMLATLQQNQDPNIAKGKQ